MVLIPFFTCRQLVSYISGNKMTERIHGSYSHSPQYFLIKYKCEAAAHYIIDAINLRKASVCISREAKFACKVLTHACWPMCIQLFCRRTKNVRFNCRPEVIMQPKLAKKGVACGVMLLRV